MASFIPSSRHYLQNAVQNLFEKNLQLATEEAEQRGADIQQYYENRPYEWGPKLDKLNEDGVILSPPDKKDYINLPLVKTIQNPNNPYSRNPKSDNLILNPGKTEENRRNKFEKLVNWSKENLHDKNKFDVDSTKTEDLGNMLRYFRENVPFAQKQKIAKRLLDEAKASIFGLEEFRAPIPIPGGIRNGFAEDKFFELSNLYEGG
ncbi:unnamed protein product [Amoebophrya sp. A120]|nr:unnamed protein product [Amoebophrya sp. A120]CAD7975689.1 unnamed protein product [Amoebophrya sp. A120]|eukprot:GSA120T00014353001.1